MGWRANPLAAAFMAHVRSTREPRYQASLAFSISSPRSARIEDLPFNQQDNFRGARTRAAQLGYVLEPVWLHEPGMNAANLARVLRRRGVPGMIVPGLLGEPGFFDAFEWGLFSTVALGHGMADTHLHRVAFNYANSVPMALHRLFELGYRRIAVVVSATYDRKVNHGWLYPLYYEQRQPWGRQWIRSCVFSGSESSDRRRVRTWIEKERPDVILGEYLAWHVLHEMGWRIPQEVAFATFDWSPDHPDVGGIDQCHDIIGSMAVDVLASQLMQNERGLSATPKMLQIAGKWRDGSSVPPRPHADLLERSRAS